MYYIYLTTNLINGKKYIGQHKGEINDTYFGSGSLIKKAIQKYGKENFTKEILAICDTREEADEKEKMFITQYNAVEDDNFYNLQEGGSGGDGWRAWQRWREAHPEEAKEQDKQAYERLQKWAKENPEEYYKKVITPLIEGAKQWKKEHPEQVQEHMKKVNISKEKWQQEHTEEHQKQVQEWQKLGSIVNSQKIMCITTGEIFPSQCEAARQYNIPQSNISKCLKGERKSAGKHPETKQKLVWVLIEE